jgi:ribonucleoside-triphosphate reductase (thioredoxin)
MDVYSQYIYKSRYARLNEAAGRRENWDETVKRYCDYWSKKFPEIFPYEEVYQAIFNLEVMPSMRALMTAGPALDRDNVAGYNCAYLPIDHVRGFDEGMYILMCGTGKGFSVERQNIAKLPEVAHEFHRTDTCVIVGDSKIGWASALREIIALLYAGKIPSWDVSRVRPAGSRLKTFGGRASGPEPLSDLFQFLVSVFPKAAGRRLNSVEVHDICCKIADVVVVGGVRRSALISLSNLTDERMQRSKMGQWWEDNGQRALANNSTAYTEKPDIGIFLKEWTSLYESKSGERGIFNRIAAKAACKATGRRDDSYEFGTNPCGEIILRPNQFCNLSEVVVRCDDDRASLLRKVRIATIIGTFQSTLTNFRYLRPIWKKNCEEERLLGVSLTGIMDNELMAGRTSTGELESTLKEMKDHAITTNKEFADKLGIGISAAITTVKPSGTVSQLVDSASGIHPRYSPFYLRTVRADKKDPISLYLRAVGVYVEDDVTKPGSTDVFYFPQMSPPASVSRHEMGALDQLAHYLIYKEHWCEHNPSITVYLREDEWMEAGAWVYRNFDKIGGISFLPYSDHIYRQAPYQEITREEYLEWKGRMPKEVDWDLLKEKDDNTTGSQEYACMGGTCEI